MHRLLETMKEIKEILETIEDAQTKKVCLNIYADLEKELKEKPAAVKYHHNQPGGLYRHVKEVMNLALEIYDARPNSYSCKRDDVIVSAFVHDFDKIDLYEPAPEWKKIKYGQPFGIKSGIVWMNQTGKTVRLCCAYGLELSDDAMNAISLHHGGWSVDASSPNGYVYSSDFTNLATILHCADLLSSFILGRS